MGGFDGFGFATISGVTAAMPSTVRLFSISFLCGVLALAGFCAGTGAGAGGFEGFGAPPTEGRPRTVLLS